MARARTDEKLDELHERLEHASDMIDEIADKDERKWSFRDVTVASQLRNAFVMQM